MTPDPDLHARSPDGTTIHAGRHGDGPSLVVVPGALSSADRWSPCLPSLAAERTVFVIDRRGRGRSGDTLPYAPEREVEDVLAVVNAVGGPTDLLGHSSGAILALQAAEQTPPALRRLVLYEPPVFTLPADRIPDDLPERLDAFLTVGDRSGAVATFFREGPRVPDDQIRWMRSDDVWATLIKMAPTVAYDARIARDAVLDAERLAAMRAPTLMLIGGASPARMRMAAEGVVAMLPDVTVEELPGQGHVAMMTAPQLFADAVNGFLDASG